MRTTIDFPITRKMRQSTIGTADSCQYRLYWSLDERQPYKGSIMRAAGTAYHAGVAEGYEQRKGGVPFDMDSILDIANLALQAEVEDAGEHFIWEFQAKTSRQDQIIWTFDDAWNAVRRALSEYWSHGGYAWPTSYQIAGVEYWFEMQAPDRPEWSLSGTVDLVLFDPSSNWFTVVDHKLTKKKWYPSKATAAGSAQAAFYINAMQKIFETPNVTFVYDVYGLDGTFNRLPAHRTPEQIAVTMQKADALMTLIDRGGPFLPNPGSFLCHQSYCDWWNECEFGRTLKGGE